MTCFLPCFGIYTIHEKEVGIVEKFGRASRTEPAGCVFLIPFVESLRATMSLKIQKLDCRCETKSKDNVFVTVVIAVLYRVMPEKVNEAFYKLADPQNQMKSYVYDVVRSSMPKMTLDEAFASKDTVAGDVKRQLTERLQENGYDIVASLVIDIEPSAKIKASMNDILASSRQREARSYMADAEKILQVKAAEADAESKYLNGLGVAKQRKAIMDGLRVSVNDFSSNIKGTSAQEVLDLLLLTQYFDMMKEVSRKGSHSAPTTIFLPHGPKAVANLREDLKKIGNK